MLQYSLTDASKSFLDSLGHEGLNKMLDGFDDRTAEAVCTFAFCRGPGSEPILFQGRTKVSRAYEDHLQGLKSDERTGRHCTTSWSDQLWYVQGPLKVDSDPNIYDMAGWDPIFEYEGKTYAEMDKESKV